MSECEQCASIDITQISISQIWPNPPDPDAREWALKDSQAMSFSAADGCKGCKFFLDVIKSNLKNEDERNAFIGRKEKISISMHIPGQQHVYQIKANGFEDAPIIGPGYPKINLCLAETEHDCVYTPGEHQPRRPIPADPKSKECLNMALAWLETCSTHDSCSKPTDVLLPSRLVKVGKESDNASLYVTQPQERGQYLTLSHCWGPPEKFRDQTKTIRSNLEALQQEFNIGKLSKTFQDAIVITRMLGFQYLWIDALCIVQDDGEDWARESSQMASIYHNGTIMLSALAAPDGEEGMLGERDLPRSHRFGEDGKYLWQIISNPFFSHPLDKRGWTFQERMMAPRIIHFSKNKMLWECASIECDEDSGLGRGHGLWNSNLTMTKGPFMQVADCRHSGAPGQTSLDSMEVKNYLEAYYMSIEEYSTRSLTKTFDTLPAFSGIAAAFHVPELGRYLAGLWENDLSRGLGWESWVAGKSKDEDSWYIAPSWSWASRPSWIQTGGKSGDNRSPRTMDDLPTYKNWAEKYEPRLVSYSYQTRTPDPYGQIRTASIVLHGYCRTLVVHRSGKAGPRGESIPWVHIDRVEHGAWLPWKFAAPHEYVHPSVDWPAEDLDGKETHTFLVLQVSMEIQDQESKENQEREHLGLGVVLLILIPVDETNYTYQRVGRLAVELSDEEMEPEKWDVRDIQLI